MWIYLHPPHNANDHLIQCTLLLNVLDFYNDNLNWYNLILNRVNHNLTNENEIILNVFWIVHTYLKLKYTYNIVN